MKLFSQQSSKKLLFVLRDFDNRSNNFEKIRSVVDTDIANIWKDIYKLEEYKDSKPSDFFNFEFGMLPHKVYEEENFYEVCKLLKGRFSQTAEDTLFL
jgi:hypothetical protein